MVESDDLRQDLARFLRERMSTPMLSWSDEIASALLASFQISRRDAAGLVATPTPAAAEDEEWGPTPRNLYAIIAGIKHPEGAHGKVPGVSSWIAPSLACEMLASWAESGGLLVKPPMTADAVPASREEETAT